DIGEGENGEEDEDLKPDLDDEISGIEANKVDVEMPIEGNFENKTGFLKEGPKNASQVLDNLSQQRQVISTAVDVTRKKAKSVEGTKSNSDGDDAESEGENSNSDEHEEDGEAESGEEQ
ncbi:hypothetical protein U1Q18_039458, partial [Sarracenia purpurea var. burkii]